MTKSPQPSLLVCSPSLTTSLQQIHNRMIYMETRLYKIFLVDRLEWFQGTALCSYQCHPKPFPPGQTPGTQLEGSKNPPPGTIIVYKNTSLGTKAPPQGYKVRQFQKFIYKLTLFEMKSFLVSINKMVFQ